MLSSTYQMSGTYDERAAQVDPENRLLWRMNRRRLEAEAIRDSILAVAGNLDRTMGGSLLQPPGRGGPPGTMAPAARDDSPRRSLYLPVIRSGVSQTLQVFDFGDPAVPNSRRAVTTVAPQALYLLNSPFVLREASLFAARLLAAPGDDGARARQAYLLAYGRPAADPEAAAALNYLRRYGERLAASEPDAGRRRERSWQSFCQLLFASSEFIYVQ
jgi:Protein of unknown function (DUF1553)